MLFKGLYKVSATGNVDLAVRNCQPGAIDLMLQEPKWNRLSVSERGAILAGGLFTAVKIDDARCVEHLIQSGADVAFTATPEKITAMWYAAWFGRDVIVRALAAAGSDPNFIASGHATGMSVLMAAIPRCSVDPIEHLITAGARITYARPDGLRAYRRCRL